MFYYGPTLWGFNIIKDILGENGSDWLERKKGRKREIDDQREREREREEDFGRERDMHGRGKIRRAIQGRGENDSKKDSKKILKFSFLSLYTAEFNYWEDK